MLKLPHLNAFFKPTTSHAVTKFGTHIVKGSSESNTYLQSDIIVEKWSFKVIKIHSHAIQCIKIRHTEEKKNISVLNTTKVYSW
jgi:hypothetical protein